MQPDDYASLPLDEPVAVVHGRRNERPLNSRTDEKHWHGAAPTTAMTHIAIAEALDGKAVDWLEKVSDEEYSR